MIELSHITLSQNAVMLFQDFNLRIEKGSMTVLLGPGGSGKSTLCDLLRGVRSPDRGTVLRTETTTGIGAISAFLPLLDDRSVADNLTLELEIQGVRSARRQTLLAAVADRFELTASLGKHIQEISMSERQRAAIARAVITEPLLLIADEPAAHLDRGSAEEIAHHLRREHLRGMTIAIATSDEWFASLFPEARIVQLSAVSIGQ